MCPSNDDAQAASYSLGPLPWENSVLDKAALQTPVDAQELVKEHPGYQFVTRLESLEAVRKIFSDSVREFKELLVCFHTEAELGHLFRRNRRSDLEAYEQQFQKLLYIFASSAMTLVDQARALSTKINLPGYSDRVSLTFAKNSRHRFIQELRVDVIHVTLHRPGWQLTAGVGEEATSKFILWPQQLTRQSEYNAEAKRFVAEHPNGIDLGKLVSEYSLEVLEFQDWLKKTTETVVGAEISDYLRCVKRIKSLHSRQFWYLIFKQVIIPGKKDPYSYLGQYLSDDELREINSLPLRSKCQVDRIIELVDEYGACTGDLRQTVYSAFGVTD